MRRVFLPVLLVIASALVAFTPAHAATGSLTLVAPVTVARDSSFELTGKAKNVKVGSVVTLQKRVGSSWTKVGSKKLTGTKTYRFVRTETAAGEAKFRISMKAQLGQKALVSPIRTVTVYNAITLENGAATVTRGGESGDYYDVTGTITEGPDLQAYVDFLLPGGWTEMNSSGIDLELHTFSMTVYPYPYTGATSARLRILGDADYPDATFPLPMPGVETHAVAVGTPVDVTDTIVNGNWHSFSFLALANTSYSVAISGINAGEDTGWTVSYDGGSEVALTGGFMASAPADRSVVLKWDPNVFELGGHTVSVWQTQEFTLGAANVDAGGSLGAGQFALFTHTVASCPPNNLISFTFTGPAEGTSVLVTRPSATQQPSINEFGNITLPCEVGVYTLRVRRSYTTSGNALLRWSSVV